jgi:hypothetical protein
MKVHQKRDEAGITTGEDEGGPASQGSVSTTHCPSDMAPTGITIRAPSPNTTSEEPSPKRRRVSPSHQSRSFASLPEPTTPLDLDWFPTNTRADLTQLADLACEPDRVPQNDATGSKQPGETMIPARDGRRESPSTERNQTLAPDPNTSYDMGTIEMSSVTGLGARQSMIWETIGQPVSELDSLAWGESSSTDCP